MRSLLSMLGVLLMASALPACGDSPLGPADVLRTEVSLEPARVAPGDSLRATVRVTNTADRRIVPGGPDGCLFVPRIQKDGKGIVFAGTSWLCTAAINHHEFLPGETVEHGFRFRAVRRNAGTDTLPEAGVYTLLIEFHVGLPNIRHRFRVVR